MATAQYPRWTSRALAVKRHRLSWFGHICRHDTLPKVILQGTMDGSRHRGRPRKSRNGQMTGVADASVRVAQRRPSPQVLVNEC